MLRSNAALKRCAQTLRSHAALTRCAHMLRSHEALTRCAQMRCPAAALIRGAQTLHSNPALTRSAQTLRSNAALKLCGHTLRAYTKRTSASYFQTSILGLPCFCPNDLRDSGEKVVGSTFLPMNARGPRIFPNERNSRRTYIFFP